MTRFEGRLNRLEQALEAPDTQIDLDEVLRVADALGLSVNEVLEETRHILAGPFDAEAFARELADEAQHNADVNRWLNLLGHPDAA